MLEYFWESALYHSSSKGQIFLGPHIFQAVYVCVAVDVVTFLDSSMHVLGVL